MEINSIADPKEASRPINRRIVAEAQHRRPRRAMRLSWTGPYPGGTFHAGRAYSRAADHLDPNPVKTVRTVLAAIRRSSQGDRFLM